MSVIGIDFGNESCYVATAKAGGIETLSNDYSLRATPSCVAFDNRKRILGVGAKNQQLTNMKNTVFGFKHLIGRQFNDPHVQKEIQNIPNKIEEIHNGKIGVIVNYLGKEQSFTPEQLTAMLFTKLKETSADAMQTQVNECVITCPVYFTNKERVALLAAAEIADLHVLRLMNETTATALYYGFYKPDLSNEKPRTVIFVDCGQSSLQVSACVFTKGRLKMLASTWDRIGGRDFDRVIAQHFGKEFKERYNIDVNKNPRAMLRLLTECEKLKRQMSANSTKLPLNVECIMDEVDVSSSMQRTEMEELCAPLFARVEQTFRQLLEKSKVELSQIHSVEIVGGTSRIPAIKQIIERVFGQPASTTLNQDESVSRGAALQCAIMSPAVRVRDFGITDVQNYPVKVCWESDGFLQAGEIVVFPEFHAAPFSRLLTLNRKEPFTLTVHYAQPVPYPDQLIVKYHIHVKPNDSFEYQEVKIKLRINQHGIVLISNASLVNQKELEEQQKNSAAENGDQTAKQPMEVDENNTQDPEGDKKKKAAKVIDLKMDCGSHGTTLSDINELCKQEGIMIQNDAQEILRVDAKNNLEEYIYDLRNKLQADLERYVTENEREQIGSELQLLENWLYEDGEDCERDLYIEKLNSLKERVKPIQNRQFEFEKIPVEFKYLEELICNLASLVEIQSGGSPDAYLQDEQYNELRQVVEDAEMWLKSSLANFKQTSPTTDCNVKRSDVIEKTKHLESLIAKIHDRLTLEENNDEQNGSAKEEKQQQGEPTVN